MLLNLNAYADAKARIAQIQVELKDTRAESKRLSDSFANFMVAAKPYIDAKKILTQSANYEKLDEIAAIYEAAKVRYEESLAKAKADAERTAAEEKAYSEKLKAEKAAAKAAKKNNK